MNRAFLFKRRWILTTLLVLIAAAIMVRLGFWQLERLAGKRAYIDDALAEINADPLVLRGDETDLDAQDLRYRRATATGEYDFEHEILLKSQLYQGQTGYHLITPLRIAGSERAVLADRGWVPLAEAVERLSEYQEPGIRQVEGRIEPEDRRPQGAMLPEGFEREWYRVDIGGIQNQTPYELLPFTLALTPDDVYTGLPNRNPPEIILDEGPHLGYAIQWFLFAIVVPIVYAVQVRKIERKEEK